MKKVIAIIVALLALAGTGGAEGTVNEFTLPNGLKVLHSEVSRHPLVTVQCFLRGGTINEKESQAGIANLTQTLMLQETKSRDPEKLAREIEDIGGSLSSDIEHDYTSFGISLMDARFEKAMEILSDIVLRPAFSPAELEKERANILASIKSRKDQIFYVANDLFLSTFYGAHPYSWPDVGKAETVSRFTRDDVAAWHRDHYHAADLLLVIVGNVSFDTAKRLAAKYFAACPPGTSSATFTRPQEPPAKKLSPATKRFKQAYLMIGFPAPDLTAPEFTTLKVVNALLGSRMSGRLFTELREKLSLAYEVNSFYPSRRTLSRFVVYLGLEKKNLELSKRRIAEILDDLRETPVSAKELDETKQYIRGAYLLDHQTVNRTAWYMGWWEANGRGYAYDARYLDDLMAVTPADIQGAARKYFGKNFVQVEIIPE